MSFILTFLARRLVQGVLIVLLVSFTIFSLLRLTPGDPARTILGRDGAGRDGRATARDMGLRDPIVEQYGRYLDRVVQGRLRHLVHQDRYRRLGHRRGATRTGARAPLVIEPDPRNLALHAAAGGVGAGVHFHDRGPGIAGGPFAGRWPDKLALYLSSIFVSLPNFWFAIVLALMMTAQPRWIPSIGYQGFAYTILPAW